MKSELIGRVTSGRGVGRQRVRTYSNELAALTGETMVHGSLNVLLETPVQFVNARAMSFAGGHRLIWKGSVSGMPVWLYRWRYAPLHVVEIIAATRLRDALRVRDGDKIRIEVLEHDLQPMSALCRLGWMLLWSGREHWYYKRDSYALKAEYWSRFFGANQAGTLISLIRTRLGRSTMPPAARNLLSVLRGRRNRYEFERLPLDAADPQARSRSQVRNILNYTKTSGTIYSAQTFPAGYHTIEVNGERLAGQRDPAKRIAAVPVDFEGKSVLDIGSNQGGMLFQLDHKVRWGIGIDFDPRMVNAANFVNGLRKSGRLSFFVFDLEKEPLDLIRDFLPEPKVDIVFLLSVCMWLKNWREVMAFAAEISSAMLFETNGSPTQQTEQHQELLKLYQRVDQLSEASMDDPSQRKRKLYYCQHPV